MIPPDIDNEKSSANIILKTGSTDNYKNAMVNVANNETGMRVILGIMCMHFLNHILLF